MAKNQILAVGFGLSLALSSLAVSQTTSASAAAPGTAGAAPASGNPAPTVTKIGVVQIQEAILATEEGKKEFEALQQRFSPKQAELKSQNDEVENLKKQYQAQADKLSDDEKNSRARSIDSKQKALQRSFEDAQGEFQQAEQEVLDRLGAKMLKTLEKYAQANGYSIILDVSNPQTSPVLWATQGNVITKELVEAYNADNPVAGAAPKPAAAKAPAKPAAHPAGPATTPKKP
ncbi:MAG TPA: OmpH family outer membrane protein [Candidatus Angelobacter sp.]|nr:OmpH family outer membrane protein [Candidatus Angelobacter sp.]